MAAHLGRSRLAVAAAAFVCAAAPAASPAAGPARCATSALSVWLDTRGDGAAGSVYYKLELTNLSGRSCAVYGYPGVSAVDLAGRQLGRAASRDRAVGPRRVVLAHGATATAVLRIVQAGNFDPPACRPVTAAGLRVYPPDELASKLVPFPFRACARPGPAFLSVRTAVAG